MDTNTDARMFNKRSRTQAHTYRNEHTRISKLIYMHTHALKHLYVHTFEHLNIKHTRNTHYLFVYITCGQALFYG